MTITITWDTPMPAIVRNGAGRQGVRWEDELAPYRHRVGESGLAVIYHHDGDVSPRVAANNMVQNCKNRLNKVCPYEDWKFGVRLLHGGDVGVWIRYDGVMSEDEYMERMANKATRGAKIMAGKKAKANKSR